MTKGRERGWFLKEWRIKKGLSQEFLAAAIGSSKGYISDLEAGKRRYNRDHLESLAAVLEIKPRDLLEDPTPAGADARLVEIQQRWREASEARRKQIASVVRAITATGTDDA